MTVQEIRVESWERRIDLCHNLGLYGFETHCDIFIVGLPLIVLNMSDSYLPSSIGRLCVFLESEKLHLFGNGCDI